MGPKPDQLLKITNALGVSINAFMEFELETVSDIISLLMRMDEQSDITWIGKKDTDGKYIPSSISISFNDDNINKALSTYMEYRDAHATFENATEYTTEKHQLNISETKNRLLLFNDALKKKNNSN